MQEEMEKQYRYFDRSICPIYATFVETVPGKDIKCYAITRIADY